MMNRENGVVRAAGWLAAGVSVAALVGAIGLPGCARDHAGATASTLKAGDTADPRTGLAPRAATAPRAAGTTPEQEKFLEDWAATYRFTHGQPKAITLTPDGTAVLFLRSGARSFVQDLYEFDVKTKQERVLLTAEKVLSGGEEKLTAEELARRERMRMASRGIVAYELSDDGKSILVPLSGRLFVVERASGASRELKSGAGLVSPFTCAIASARAVCAST
jgi:dipeptidyl-peptidase-4